MAKLEIGNNDYMVVRGVQGIKDLLKGAKNIHGRNHILAILRRNIEDFNDDQLCMEITRTKARTYELSHISDSENSYYLDTDTIRFTPSWYDIKRFNNLVEIDCWNELLWDFKEKRFSA